ncbi:hypothetical protein BU17DRAFT_79015 [Hysterangium stoloniferum]|nr:hypothetical protein BU17DRAFT_79015 [Hysterangium stoloniferum]
MVISCHLLDAPPNLDFQETAKSFMASAARTLVDDVKKVYEKAFSYGNGDSDVVFNLMKKNVLDFAISGQY